MPEERLKLLIDVAHKHDCYVSTRGFIERVLATSGGSPQVVSKYFTDCKNMGFDVLEISSDFLSIPTASWLSLIEDTKKHGLKSKPEVGIQWGAGGDAPVARVCRHTRPALAGRPRDRVPRRRHTRTPPPPPPPLARSTAPDPGTQMIMIESEGTTENVASWRTDAISAISSALPAAKIAADPAVFAYHVQNQGAEADLFVDRTQILQLACLRKGIWGSGSTFGRIVTYGGHE
ncbi:hypothetical protein PHLGIDRAFT_114984 [Phlebiopsis gigantea 11061_1 CR5-6]|uniref:Uncharacterized protein n=1 Tax=Phlebiopsis gigantea (strain 11061_1 CR5-6) TaxID=745531 RepID=A0A0C3PTY6_PHLG1|nr:hypothetical protein PHLGIDRAFT_114984 [Phlebiopsis gigantea 11061_1 CR5-6]